MKYYLSLLAAATIALSACSQTASTESAPAEQPAQSAESAPAAEASTAPAAEVAAPAADDKCHVVVESNDQMKFNTDNIQVSKSCAEFKVTLKDVGQAPKTAMGHNVVIAKSADQAGILADGAGVGVDGDFLKADDARVVAHTKMIGGGEEAAVTFSPSKLADGDYVFFCSFPGHAGLMHGKVTLVE